MAGRRTAPREPMASSSRIPRRTTRATASQSESESASELPYVPTPRSTRNRQLGHRKTASFSATVLQEEDEDTERTPRPPKRFRTEPLRSRRDSHSTAGRGARRLGVRQSLMGPAVQETTVDARVEMIGGIAGDCLIKLLNLDGRRSGKGKQRMEEAAKAWDVLQSSRELYLFSQDSSLFPLLSDMTSSLHPDILNAIDTNQLVNALALNNLATFVWVISQPDIAQELHRSKDIAATPAKRKGKGRAAQDDELLGHVRRRNAILLKAWKEFWNVAVPRNKRSSEKALELWLDFATIIYIFFQTPTIDPLSDPDDSLPEIVQRIVDDLFSSSAVDRYGQWDLDEDGESQDEEERTGSEEKRITDARWKKLAQQRRRMLDQTAIEVSMRKFPYDDFRSRVHDFVREEVLGQSDDSAMFPASRNASLAGPHSPHAFDTLQSEEESDDNTLPDLKEETSMTQGDSSVDQDDAAYPDDRGQLGEGEEEIDWNLAADVLDELEREEEDFIHGAERLSLQSSPRKREHKTLSPAMKRRRTSELEEWNIRDRHRSAELPSFFGHKSKPARTTFSFGRRQEDAEQIGWETQSAEQRFRKRMSTPLGLSVRPSGDTPRARATSNHLPRHSMSRLDELRSAQEIFKPRSSTPTQSQLRSERIVPSDSLFRQVAQKFIPVAGIFSTPPVEKAIESDDEDEDLMPATQQLRGTRSSRMRYEHPESDIHAPSSTDIDPDEDDVQMPGEMGFPGVESAQDALAVDFQMDSMAKSASQKTAPRSVSSRTAPVSQEYALADLDINQDVAMVEDAPATAFEQPAQPTAQQAFITSRHKVSKPDAFAAPNAAEEAEDRQLIKPKTPTSASRRPQVKTSPYSPPRLLPRTPTPPPATDIADPRSPSLAPPGSALRPTTATPGARGSARPSATPRPSSALARSIAAPPNTDPYMVDEDGEPLETDDEYIIPPGHILPKSRLHGNLDGQTSIYSRMTGKQKWTKGEELLLYRTTQKVPMSEIYPLRVVWHLHGEFGTLSHKLEMFNPQHMKDKMRVIVTRRRNNQEPIEGRARAWLPSEDPRKQAYESEGRVRREEAIEARRAGTLQYVQDEAAKREATQTPRKGPAKKRKARGKRKGKNGQAEDVDELASEEGDDDAGDADGEGEGEEDEYDPDVEGEPELDQFGSQRKGPSWKVAPKSDPRGRTRSSRGNAAPETPVRRGRGRGKKRARIQSPPTDRDARHAARAQRQAEAAAVIDAHTAADLSSDSDQAGRASEGRVVVEIPSRPGRKTRSAATQPAPRMAAEPAVPAGPSRRATRSTPAAPARVPPGRRAAKKSSYQASSTNLATGRRTRLAGGQADIEVGKGRATRSRSRGRNRVRSDSSDTPHDDDGKEGDDGDGDDEVEAEAPVAEQTQKDAQWLDRHMTEQQVRRQKIASAVTAP